MAELVAQFIDRSKERSTVTFKIADQGGAVTITEILAFGAALETALEGISLLTLKNIWFRQSLLTEDPTIPVNVYANRENAARVFFTDDTAGKHGHVSVPGPDLANVDRKAASDDFDLTDTEMAALVTFIESYVEIGGNGVDVTGAIYVGRSN
jgi:hypothetical protein